MRSTVLIAVVAAMAGSACSQQSAQEPTSPVAVADKLAPAPAPITRIEPGTKLNLTSLPEHTRIVFRSRPRVAAGDVQKVAKSVADALQNFTTLVVVQTEPDPTQPGRFRRGPFMIGVGTPVGAEDVVLTKETAAQVGIGLGFFERRVLGEREKELSTVLTPGSSPTMAMFDFGTLYLRDDKRVPIVLRYATLVDPTNGQVDSVYWVLDSTPEGLRFSGDSLWLLPKNHQMDWDMHVDGGKVTLGAPRGDAFAVVKLPQGAAMGFPEDLRTAAASRAFSTDASSRLEQRLRDVLNRRTSK